MKLRYEQATLEDIEAIFLFNKELIDRYEDISKIEYGKVLAWIRQKLERHIGEYTCVLCDEQKAGYYRFWPDGEKMELDDLYLFPEYRNLGIGTTVIKECIASTACTVYLYVFTKNAGAVRLYERLGFKVVEKIMDTRYIMERKEI